MKNKIISKVTACALLGTMVAYTAPVFAYTKDETIYSKLDSKGNSYNTIVNNHIKNEDGLQIINDMSDLLNIENESNDEKPEQNGNNLVWKAEGNDVYYQGESQKELPIECDVRYELDGKIVDAKDIVGKSGKVKVTLEYKNKDAHVVNINGRDETLYTPFVVVCGTIIDNSNNKNIEISNGKEVDNGNKTIVVGMCLPGMQESLNISKGKLDIPNSVEITMDATDFELNNIVTYVTPKIIEESDLNLFDNIDEIFSKVNTLQESSNQLEEGANTLRDGIVNLDTRTNQLTSGLNSKISQYENIRNKTADTEVVKKQIIDIINQELEKMLPDLEEQVKIETKNTITNHKTDLENSVVDTTMKYTKLEINKKLDEIKKNGGSILTQAQQKQLEEALAKDIKEVFASVQNNIEIKSLLDELQTDMKTEAKNSVKTVIDSKKVNTSASLTQEQIASYAKVYSTQITQIKDINPEITDAQALQIIGVVSNSTLTSVEKEIDTKIDAISAKNASLIEQKIKSELDTYISKVTQDVANKFTNGNTEVLKLYEEQIQNSIIESLKQKLNQSEAIKTIKEQSKSEITNTIDTIVNETANDLSSVYTETIAKEVANNLIEKQLRGELSDSELDKELSKYETLINSKLNEVDNEVAELKSAFAQLTNGTQQLAEASRQLASGMTKFNKQGIQTICSYINGDLKGVTARVEKLKELSEEYNNFTMLNDGNEGNVKFIMIIDSLNKEQSTKQDTVLNDNKEK